MRANLVAAALALAVPLSAHAQPVSEATGPDTYLRVHLGAYVPASNALDLSTGYTFGAVFGARFTQIVAVECGVAYEHARSNGTGGATLSDVPISVSVAARLPLKKAELALYAGPDLHLVSVRTGSGLARQSSSDTAFGGHGGLRAGFNVWPTTLVGLDARASFARASFGSGHADINSVRIAVTLEYRF